MVMIGVSVTKDCAFRGGRQPFSNVYFFARGLGGATDAELEAILDEVVATEKLIHGSDATFLQGRVWIETGNAATSEMRVTKDLTGTGTLTPIPGLDRERAILVRVRAGKSATGKPVYLRKWYHTLGAQGGSGAFTSDVLANKAALSTAERSAQATQADKMLAVGAGPDIWGLVAKSGREVDQPAAFECHAYLEHHQLGDQWRG